MSTENELIHKSYYQTIIDQNGQDHPVEILGKMYIEEMQQERPDLSSIRFAQGEVYYLNHDYEAAVYKWQQPLEAHLIPWAQKNIADAHMEMGIFDYAERYYKDVETHSDVLKSEVLLKLFALYNQQNQVDKSVETIQDAVRLNPDYSEVTKIAQAFFEEIKDWNHAVELAIDEGIRTKSLSWFEVLEGYVRQDLTAHLEPHYFNDALATLLHIDAERFESLTEGLWHSYKQSDFYIQWVEVINDLLLNEQWEQVYSWMKLPALFEKTYLDLISGQFLIRDISDLIQKHLTNWLKLSSVSNTLMSSTAILSWKEVVPSELAATLVHDAEQHFGNSDPNQTGKQEGIELLDAIQAWAQKEGLLENFTEFMNPRLSDIHKETASLSDIRDAIKDAIDFMLNQRVALENVIVEDIHWREELLTDLRQIREQLAEMEEEKARLMTEAFGQLKVQLKEDVMDHLPTLLRNSSDLVKVDSDFSTLHMTINEEMNKRIARYLEKDALDGFNMTFQQWLEKCEREFQDSQDRCHELSRDIHAKYDEENLVLAGDFKVLDDWQRDIDRISRGVQRFEKVNILLRNDPSQLLLKGASKLLGHLSKNKDLLYSRYKNYIENADYREVASDIIDPFIQQLELFEHSIEWDVNRFFIRPNEVLHELMEEVQVDIDQYNDTLNNMRENPEIYRDPLTLFELKLRQYELMNRLNESDL